MQFLGCLLVLLLTASSAQAWSWDVHRVIALVAYENLLEPSKAEVDRLLPGPFSFEHASVWADDLIIYRPGTASWHHINLPRDATAYDAKRDCSQDACLVAQIHRHTRILADKSVADALRTESLKFLIHLVADIHQPLHVAFSDDRSGSDTWVSVRLQSEQIENLYVLWNRGLYEHNWRSRAAAVADISQAMRPQWLGSTPEDWANESFTITKTFIYRSIMAGTPKARADNLPESYADEATPIIRERISMAAARLAGLINDTLK